MVKLKKSPFKKIKDIVIKPNRWAHCPSLNRNTQIPRQCLFAEERNVLLRLPDKKIDKAQNCFLKDVRQVLRGEGKKRLYIFINFNLGVSDWVVFELSQFR